MRSIECISRDSRIYIKGEITFQVIMSDETASSVLLNPDLDILYVDEDTYKNFWRPRLRNHFPSVCASDIYWDRWNENNSLGKIIIYDVYEPISENRFLSHLSDNPDLEFLLSGKELKINSIRNQIADLVYDLSGVEKETLESILDKFDNLFYDLI